MSGEPKIHVLRAMLPWRPASAQLTECGKVAASLPGDVLTRDEARSKAREWGQRRTALVLCMTCDERASCWASWDEDPVAVMQREVSRWQDDSRDLLTREMRALAMLAQEHAEAFAAAVDGLSETTPIDALRAKRVTR